MPSITVTANFHNIIPDPKVPLQFHWNVDLVFNGRGCPYSLNRITRHTPIEQVTATNKFTIPFTQIRGGGLAIAVRVLIGNRTLTARTEALRITGTNPSIAALQAFAPDNNGFRRLMRFESGLRQFLSPNWPLFSADNRGGVGICQITDPTPTDDQVWSWKANLEAGWQLYQCKQRIAAAYPAHVRNSPEFKALIELPDYTPEQRERDTLRGYNGYAAGLHEYRARINQTGTAEWELITPAERNAQYDKLGIDKNHRGDPNYVNEVLSRDSF